MAALDVAAWEAVRAVIEDPYGFIDQCFAQSPAADEAAVQRLFDVQDRFRAIFASDAHLDAVRLPLGGLGSAPCAAADAGARAVACAARHRFRP